MLNYIAAQFYTFLLRGPMIDPGRTGDGLGHSAVHAPARERLAGPARFPRPGCTWGWYWPWCCAAAVYLLLWRTTWGFRLRAAGAEAKAARYAGISVHALAGRGHAVRRGLRRAGGAVEVTGVHHRAIENISSGYGFAGIVVALFGALHPAGIVPAAVFFGLLLVGADMTQRSAGVPANMILVLQGVIILAIVRPRCT